LHRETLVRRLVPLQRHPHVRVRVWLCDCLARLGSRAALPALDALRADASREVAGRGARGLDGAWAGPRIRRRPRRRRARAVSE
jgi:hypothetical protein